MSENENENEDTPQAWDAEVITLVLTGTKPGTTVTVQRHPNALADSRFGWNINHEFRWGSRVSYGGWAPTLAEAQQGALEGYAIIDTITSAKVDYIVRYEASDKIDMHGGGDYECSLCGATSSPCLHEADEVRKAFRLLQRFGFRKGAP